MGMSAWRCGLAAAGLLLVASAPAPGAALDCKTVEIVVPYSAGAFVDALARLLTERIATELGRPAVVVNRPGGSTIIATLSVRNARPDGCTLLLVGVVTLATNSTFHAGKLPYDTLKDLVPVSVLATSPAMLMAHPSLGVDSLEALIALGQRHPGKLNYASAGKGSNPNLAMEVLKLKLGVDFVHVPYKGLAPATTDLLANHVQLLFSSPAGFEELVKSGRIEALAVTGKARLKALPDVRTFSELGYAIPELDAGAAFGIVAPAQTPPEVVSDWARMFQDAMRDPSFAAAVERLGLQPVGNAPSEFKETLAADIERWGDLIRKAGIEGE